MARLIEADALHRKVKMETNPYGKPTIDYDSGVKVLEWIDKAPTVDAVPVRHGKIIETIENGRMKRVFSCCGEDFTKLTCWMTPNYCPNCGAKMDKEKNE